MGDAYYKKKDFGLARIEYDRAILDSSNESVRAKIGLTLIRERRFRQAIESLQGKSFDIMYFRMYGDLRANFRNRFLMDQGELEESKLSE